VDVPLRQAVLTLNFWLYVFCLFVCFGGGNYVNANIAQMVQSLDLPAKAIPFLVTIMSLASVSTTTYRWERLWGVQGCLSETSTGCS
jgi:TRAP-type C4-dicarboxylate transport system permease small subunit